MNSELVMVGKVRSWLKERSECPKQGFEGAPEARLEIDARYREALVGMRPGMEIIVLTWLHLGDRTTLQVHPRDDPRAPLAGVFVTRSSDRPNPIGLHRVTVLAVDDVTIHVRPLEVVDGTPVVDIKAALPSSVTET